MASKRDKVPTAADSGQLSLQDAAEQVGVTPATLRRWMRQGLITQYEGSWTPIAVTQARVVARMRERGHSLAELRRATEEGRLAFAPVEELFAPADDVFTLEQAAKVTGLEPGLIERINALLGLSPMHSESLTADDVHLLRYVSTILSAGLPLVPMLQLVRVYGQAMAQVADAEVRLFHLYVHEPLMRSDSTGPEMAEQMLELTREVLPLASPVMDQVHRRYLQHQHDDNRNAEVFGLAFSKR